MQILAEPTSPYGNANDRSFKTVPAALRFMVRSYFEKQGVARQVAVYEMTAPIVRIDFLAADELVLTSGEVAGWEVGEKKSLEEAVTLTKKLHLS